MTTASAAPAATAPASAKPGADLPTTSPKGPPHVTHHPQAARPPHHPGGGGARRPRHGLISAAPALAADAPFRAAPDIALGAGALPRSVAVGDFDSDGRQDLALADTGRDSLRVLIGRGDGTFVERQILPGFDNALDVATADFDADGVEDLAFAGFRSDRTSVTILRGTGDGRFTTRSGFTVPARCR